MTTFNTILKMLKKEYDFLYLSESSCLQQVYRGLINAYNKFFHGECAYPRFKSKKYDKKSFRMQNNGNIKIKDNTSYLPKLGRYIIVQVKNIRKIK